MERRNPFRDLFLENEPVNISMFAHNGQAVDITLTSVSLIKIIRKLKVH